MARQLRALGTVCRDRRLLAMRIPEENCNMVLLAAVTLVSVAIAGGAALVGSSDITPGDRTFGNAQSRAFGQAQSIPSSNTSIIKVSDQAPVRVVGAPFVPNTNPSER